VLQNCENCGAVNSANARTCYVCVSPLKPSQPEPAPKRRYASFPDDVPHDAEASDTGTLIAQDLMRGLERAAKAPRKPRRVSAAEPSPTVAAARHAEESVAVATLTEETPHEPAHPASLAVPEATAASEALPAVAEPALAAGEEAILESGPAALPSPESPADLIGDSRALSGEHEATSGASQAQVEETFLGSTVPARKDERARESVPEPETVSGLNATLVEGRIPEAALAEFTDDAAPEPPPAAPRGATTWGHEPVPPAQVVSHEDWRRELTNRVEAYRARHGSAPDQAPQDDLPFVPETVAGPSPDAPRETAAGPSAAAEPLRSTLRTSARRRPETVEILALQPEFDFASAAEPEQRPQAGLVPVAELGERRIAGLLDAAFLSAAYLTFLLVFTSLVKLVGTEEISATRGQLGVLGVTFFLFYVQYFVLFTLFGGTTPGMLLRRLRVVTFDGSTPDAGQLLQRSLGYVVSASALLLGFLWSLWDEDHLTWHDRMSRTYLTNIPPAP
jgi:uncharacterized RDD family membrane protein YckC